MTGEKRQDDSDGGAAQDNETNDRKTAAYAASSRSENSMACNVIAGLAAGVSGTLLGHPLDTLKTFMQVGSSSNSSSHATKNSNSTTVLSLLRRLFQEGNVVRRLYIGVGPPLVSSVMLNAVCFAVYNKNVEVLKPLLIGNEDSSLCITSLASQSTPPVPPPHPTTNTTTTATASPSTCTLCCSMIPFIAGWNVGFVSSIISTPFEVVKRQQQILGKANSVQYALHMYNTRGLRGFFQGYFINTVRECLFLSVYFGLYNTVKEKLISPPTIYTDTSKSSTPPTTDGRASTNDAFVFIIPALAGGISGALAWASSYPLDAVCTRVMSPQIVNHTSSKTIANNHVLRVIADEWRSVTKNGIKKGIAKLYSGVGLSMARASIVSSTRFTTYELTYRYINGNS